MFRGGKGEGKIKQKNEFFEALKKEYIIYLAMINYFMLIGDFRAF